MFDVMSVYVGDRLGLYRALRDGGPATPAELAAAGRHRRALRPGVAGAAGRDRHPRRRRRRPPRPTRAATRCRTATRRRSSIPTARIRSRRSARSVVGVREGPPRSCSRRIRTGGGVDWADYGAGHDRGPGRLQPAVAASARSAPRSCPPCRTSTTRLAQPSRRPASPTSPAASAGRRSRSPGLPERQRRRLRPRPVVDRARHARTRAGRRRRPGDASRCATPPIRRLPASTTSP